MSEQRFSLSEARAHIDSNPSKRLTHERYLALACDEVERLKQELRDYKYEWESACERVRDRDCEITEIKAAVYELKKKLNDRIYQVDKGNNISILSCENCSELNMQIISTNQSLAAYKSENQSLKATQEKLVEALKAVLNGEETRYRYLDVNGEEDEGDWACEALAQATKGEQGE